MKSTFLFLLVAAARLSAQCGGSQLVTTFSNLATQYGQYVTADCSGDLTSFTYQVETGGSAVTLTVRSGMGCGGAILRTVNFTEGTFNLVNFSPAIAVTEGQTYSFIVTNPNFLNVKLNTSGGYQTGGLIHGPSCQLFPAADSWDMVFSYAIAAPLPAELVDFQAIKNGHAARLDWQTASERNCRGFEIQRSTAGSDHWEALSFVAGQGTTTDRHDYFFIDENPQPGLDLYRLRQIDLDGQEAFSPIESVEYGVAETGLAFYPNPARDGATTISLPTDFGAEGLLEIFDPLGRRVFFEKMGTGGASASLDLSALPVGVYSARLESEGRSWAGRLAVATR